MSITFAPAPIAYSQKDQSELRRSIQMMLTENLTVSSINAQSITTDTITARFAAIGTLSEITPNAGIIVSGRLTSASGAISIYLDSTGTDPVILSPNFSILADGTATFSGITSGMITSSDFRASNAVFVNSILLGGLHHVPGNHTTLRFQDDTSALGTVGTVATFTSIDYSDPNGIGLQISATQLKLGKSYFSTNPDLPGGTVSYGAADSGGAGFRQVLVPN